MARTIWKGSLSFGLVNVPVGLYPATQDKAIHFNQLEAGTSDRIRYKKVNERTGKEVASDRIVKGFDLGGGEYVILSDEELSAAEPEKSRLVEITDFVDLDDIDPIYFRSTYYLAPEGEAGAKAYALLRQAMLDARKVAIGTLVMRNKEYPVAIRPDDEVLKLETMYFTDEIRDPSKEVPELPDTSELQEREMSMAKLLVESMESAWDPNRYHDTHRAKVEELVESKRLGNEIVVGTVERPPTKVVDLMEVLSASIDSVKVGSKSSKTAGKTGTGAASSPTGRTARAKSTGGKSPAATPRKIGAKPAAKQTAKSAGRRKAS
jgi:DNA end-binding protein Ku